MPKIFSSKKVIGILCRDFDFRVVSQRGSHIKLRKISRNRKITTIVPVYKELATGTLRGVLELAEIDLKEFLNKARN